MISMIVISIATLIFYLFTGLLITHLCYEGAPTVSAHRFVFSVVAWPVIVLVFFAACAVFSLKALTDRLRSVI